MPGRAVKVLDTIAGLVIMAAFAAVSALVLVSLAGRKRQSSGPKDIVQLYISIIDFRKSVLSTYKEDILLDGFIKRSFCYHLDFDAAYDEKARITDDIIMTNVSVHPDSALTRAGFRKLMACIVEIKALGAMLKTAVREKVTVVRAHDPHLLGFNAFMIARIAAIPCIIQVCSNYELKDRQARGLTFGPFMYKAVERRFERFIMRHADLVLTDRDHYRAFGLIPKDIPGARYVNMGFFAGTDHYIPVTRRTDLKSGLGIPRDTKVLLYIGRLCRVKYTLDLLDMFERCLQKRNDITLAIAGDGDLKDAMITAARRKGIGDNVVFLDYVPQEKLKDLYFTADIVCFTSAGFTMIEAALAERCIIAYDFEWHYEFIGNNERGILVPFRDCRRFADEVLAALDDDARRRDLGRRARAHALKNYSRAPAIEKEQEAYRRLMERRGGEF
ncbi:MAG: glycosyltransferase [Candidatus Omnitrophica bacterium]|nr:glycosyltransferase [Candidatus Omnitrophota bacterium]